MTSPHAPLTDADLQRIARARVYAERQGCSVYAAMEYADWLVLGIRNGYIVLPAKHDAWFGTWRDFARRGVQA